MKSEVIAVYLGLVLLVYLGGKSYFAPVRWLLGLLVRAAIGAGALAFINLVGAWLYLTVPLNPYTVLFTGYLGLPGVAALLLLNRMG